MNLEHAQRVVDHIQKQRQEPKAMRPRPRLALVDMNGCFYRCWHAGADKELGFAFAETLAMIRRFVEGFDHVAICCDSPPYWRKEIHADYKAQRDAPEPQMLEQLRRTEARLADDGYCIWKCPSYEADDVIATAVRIAVSEGLEVVIGSSDKDMLQLVSDNNGVSAYSIASQITYDDRAVFEKFGVAPREMRDFLALCGDTSDNVPGVPGVGPKTAAKLLADYGDWMGVLSNCDKIKQDKLRANVFASGDSVRLAYKLVGLKDDAPINFEECRTRREPKPLAEMEDVVSEQEELQERETEPPSAPEVAAEPVNGNGAPPPSTVQTQAIEKRKDELVTAPAATFETGLQPGSLGAAYKLATGLHNSRLYTKMPNAEAIWAIIIRGREMGLGALTALDSFHIVEGRPAPGAHLLVSRAKQHPDCEYFMFVGGDDTYAEYETKHRCNPKPTRLKYTIGQAQTAGLLQQRPGKGPGNWVKRPDEMLRKTAAVQLARIEYPEALLGAYAAEEMEGA